MRRSGMFLILGLLTLAAPARGQEGLGLGIIVGEPTGLSLKTWLTKSTAFDLAAAWSFAGEGSFHVHGDYLIHNYKVFRVEKGSLPLYYGVGARVRAHDHGPDQNDDVDVGIRIPVGLTYLFQNDPFDLFLEVVPILDVAPETDVTLNASIGARYYFR